MSDLQRYPPNLYCRENERILSEFELDMPLPRASIVTLNYLYTLHYSLCKSIYLIFLKLILPKKLDLFKKLLLYLTYVFKYIILNKFVFNTVLNFNKIYLS